MSSEFRRAARLERRASAAFCLMLLAFALGCATPVGIKRTSLRDVDRELVENAITGDKPILIATQFLERLGLTKLYDENPRQALEKLREGLGGIDEHDRVLAMSELWFAAARKGDDRGEYLAAAVFAYAFLFPPTQPSPPASPYDQKTHYALELYNRGIANGLALPESAKGIELDPTPRQIQMPFGTFVLSAPKEEFLYGGYRIVHPVALGDLEIRGLRNRYRRIGVGVATAAGIEAVKGSDSDPWIPPRAKVPITAFVRFDPFARDFSGAHGTLELYDADDTPTVTVGSTVVPLASDPSAALAYRLEGAPVWDFELAGFRRSDLRISDTQKTHGLFFLNPYRPGRIPVIFVHGTLSSPARWAQMANELLGDPRIASRFQLWFYIYNSGNPILLSAGNLRDGILNAWAGLDPDDKDAALHQMVVVGHSQGGLLTKCMVVSSGTRFWDALADEPFDKVNFTPETRAILKDAIFFDPVPFVTRVIFISTPHRGSFLAENWLGMLARKLANAPASLTKASVEIATLNEGQRIFRKPFHMPTSIDNMDWSNPGLKILASLPIAPGVKANSIIPVLKPPIATGDDGVVKYQSAHIEPVESELVVMGSGHSTQDNPETIEEVRRILYEHAGIH
jgi:pimeloyl-ACP methyl ester carboxylesterase